MPLYNNERISADKMVSFATGLLPACDAIALARALNQQDKPLTRKFKQFIEDATVKCLDALNAHTVETFALDINSVQRMARNKLSRELNVMDTNSYDRMVINYNHARIATVDIDVLSMSKGAIEIPIECEQFKGTLLAYHKGSVSLNITSLDGEPGLQELLSQIRRRYEGSCYVNHVLEALLAEAKSMREVVTLVPNLLHIFQAKEVSFYREGKPLSLRSQRAAQLFDAVGQAAQVSIEKPVEWYDVGVRMCATLDKYFEHVAVVTDLFYELVPTESRWGKVHDSAAPCHTQTWFHQLRNHDGIAPGTSRSPVQAYPSKSLSTKDGRVPLYGTRFHTGSQTPNDLCVELPVYGSIHRATASINLNFNQSGPRRSLDVQEYYELVDLFCSPAPWNKL